MGEVCMSGGRKETLRITEIFYSLQGEARSVGWPTVFVRLTGCPLRCSYCDTTYSFTGGESLGLDEIVDKVEEYGARHVCVTGGEPLSQKNVHSLMQRLCDRGYQVSLETSGALDISKVDSRVVRVMDLKTPSSDEMDKNLWSNVAHLTARDQVKFVIGDRADYDWSVAMLREHRLEERAEVLFSPSYETLKPNELAEWVLEDQLLVRFQMQLHKLLWGEEMGR